ncbi:MAG: hypothetical protein LQ350_002648 [Teloschistes chrysophthalmus]|nr:MAG: hypothetical protein LQ350_002648 [Niorma chrysophthalma]
MNSLFNTALKQSSAVRRDLDAFAEDAAASSPALQETAKKELIEFKKEKAYDRIKSFRSDLHDYRQSFERLKKDRQDVQTTQARTELLGRRPHHTSTPENPYANTLPSSSPLFSSQNRPANQHQQQSQSLSFGSSPQDYTRETHALREQTFMSSTNAALDEYLERGRAVLGDLGQQKEILKGTQRRLYNVANTLGVSGETIRMVERRAKQDRWIFWTGCLALVNQVGNFGF